LGGDFFDFGLSFKDGLDESHDVDKSGRSEHGEGLLLEDVLKFV
jgi:hypothetical protein